ncbi:lysophospholipid acyltransferase family protein [Nereida sp. MMG025]|uniref:lysophospholipid acyltransferase family protein n=1 Tax=Nereida sp. MMG025 TaxID=2909981 RepID=UPI001F162501|nr:lysophospholipid acyltransferase family protein [Nereida sp. MMG025]MCF6443610.1 lysophospholipid acyltransferase family protein [Nereida sp. MMG025]
MPNRAQDRQVAREITYAHSASSRPGRALVRVTENVTGRIGLIKRVKGYEEAVAQGQDFWKVMVERYGLTLDVVGGSLDNIPKTGPLVLVANHPYGILDGLIMGYILSTVRGDFRILANSVFNKAEDIQRIILPISFDQTKDAMRQNLETRKTCLDYLGQGGAIGVFPGGTVSTAAKPFGRALDPSWRSFTAKMIGKSGATVVPVYFEGANSRLFQLASHLHTTLRMALLINEFKRRVDEPVRLRIGTALPHGEIAARSKDPKAMMAYLREQTYALSPDPMGQKELGFEFEDQHKTQEQRIEKRVY